MLKGVHPLLDAELLAILASMGHGDELALVDANFPTRATARRSVRLAGVDVVMAARAILTVLPLDTFVEAPVTRMAAAGEEGPAPVHAEFQQACEEAEGRTLTVAAIGREAFYARAREAFAVVATSECRLYGCFLVTKGVVLLGEDQ